jgi:zinc protease
MQTCDVVPMNSLTRAVLIRVALSVLVALLPVAAIAQGSAAIDKVATIEGITEYRLPNGLRVLLAPDPAKASVSVDMTYLAGSRHERYAETGTARLVQRLFFKGTSKYPAIDKTLAGRGVRFGGSTKQNYTHYFANFQANDETLQWVLQMEADRMVNALLSQPDVDAEAKLFLKEIGEVEAKKGDFLRGAFDREEVVWDGFGTTMAMEKAALTSVKLANLQAFYSTYYQVDNVVAHIAGKFDEQKVLNWIGNFFGAVPKPVRTLPATDTRLEFVSDDEGKAGEVVTAKYKSPSALRADHAALEYALFMVHDLRGFRTKRKVAFTGAFSRDTNETGLHMFAASGILPETSAAKTRADLEEIEKQLRDRPQTSEEDRRRALDAYRDRERARDIQETRADVARAAEAFSLPTAEEMQRARQHLASAAARAKDNHEKFGAKLAEYIALGDWRMFFYMRDRTAKVTAEEVAAAAAKYYRADNRVTRVVRVQGAPAPEAASTVPTVAALLKDYRPEEARVSTAPAAPATSALDGNAAVLDQRTRKFQVGGLSVSLLPKKSGDQVVALNIRLRNGDEKFLFGRAAHFELINRLLDRGTTKYQFGPADEMSRLRMRGGLAAGTANFQTTRPYIAAAIKLTGHMLREPTFPDAAAKTASDRRLVELAAEKKNPVRLATNALNRHFNIFPAGDIRNVRSFEEQEESINAIKTSDLREFYKQFAGAAKGEIAIVGDFDEADVTAALREAFGDWMPGAPYTRMAMPYKDVAPLNRTIEMPGQGSAFFAARQNINMLDTDVDHAALLVANHIFGGAHGFTSRLSLRLRLQEGLSHSVRSQLDVSSTDRGSVWSAHALADARDIAKVESVFREELARAARNGFTAGEVAAAKSAVLQRRREERLRDNVLIPGDISTGALAGQLINNSHLGRTFAWSKQFDDRIAALRVDDVNAAFRKHIVPGKVSVVKAGDFAK